MLRLRRTIGLIGGIGWAAVAAGAEPEAATGTRLVCEHPLFDFGEAAPTQIITHVFTMENKGTNGIRILNVRTGCGCTTTALATNLLAAGQKTDLAVMLDLKGRRGPQRKAVYIETDEPLFGRLRIEMAGAVVLPIEVQPEGVHFGTLGREGNAEREVLLVARPGIEFHVREAKASSPQFAVQLETKEAGRTYRVRIQSIGPRMLGTSHAMVQIVTDYPGLQEINVPVTVFVASDITVAPATLMLVQGATNNVRTYYAGVFSPSGKTFKIVAVRPPGDGLQWQVVTVSPDRYRLEIKATGALQGLDGKVMRIDTDMETMREVSIPVRVVAGPGEAVGH